MYPELVISARRGRFQTSTGSIDDSIVVHKLTLKSDHYYLPLQYNNYDTIVSIINIAHRYIATRKAAIYP